MLRNSCCTGDPLLSSTEPSCTARLSSGVPKIISAPNSVHTIQTPLRDYVWRATLVTQLKELVADRSHCREWDEEMRKIARTCLQKVQNQVCPATISPMDWSRFLFVHRPMPQNICLGNLAFFPFSLFPSCGPVHTPVWHILLLTAQMYMSKFKTNCLLKERGPSCYYYKASPRRGS